MTSSPGGGGFEDIFSSMFGGQTSPPHPSPRPYVCTRTLRGVKTLAEAEATLGGVFTEFFGTTDWHIDTVNAKDDGTGAFTVTVQASMDRRDG
ncbi:hypothetical protein [Brachybacterium sp. GCM10030252]|uniref:hypothetical protein n=1 Tax=Brachybacterium sp. GCM10030252 TaxID=3273380 RepID=UPI00361DA74D